MHTACDAGTNSATIARFLRRAEVEARTGLSCTSIYRKIAEGGFPKPVPLGQQAVGWVESEVAEWQARRIAERDANKAVA